MRELTQQSHLAVLAAVHDLTLAALYCDRLALMAAGAIVATGPPEQVLTAENISQVYRSRVVVLRQPGLPAPLIIPYADGAAPTGAVRMGRGP